MVTKASKAVPKPEKDTMNTLTKFFDEIIKRLGLKDEKKPSEEGKNDDGQTNWTFVKSFDLFKSFEEAANFIHFWIKVKKHKPTEI